MWLSHSFLLIITFYSFTDTQSTNQDCRCVNYFLCNSTTGRIITDGTLLINPRIGTCGDGEIYCCPTIPLKAPIKNLAQISCGTRSITGVGFKIDDKPDDDALFGEFPWAVDILINGDTNRCGGALIHPSVILTAAHCVLRPNNYTIRAGDWDSSNTQEILRHQELSVAKIKIHEDYNPAVHYNDIALLFLNGSFQLKQHIMPICLPENSTISVQNPKCFVTGRGKDVNGLYKPILKKIELSLVSKENCQNKLREIKLLKRFQLHRSFICAGGEENQDACIGDGGGALVCPVDEDEERYEQVGIVSWGVTCHQGNMPGVYTNVKYFRQWIDQEVDKFNILPR